MCGGPLFIVGNCVKTIKGARFEGEVRAVFTNRRGQVRVVVEATHPEFEGTLHVYPVEQLIDRPSEAGLPFPGAGRGAVSGAQSPTSAAAPNLALMLMDLEKPGYKAA